MNRNLTPTGARKVIGAAAALLLLLVLVRFYYQWLIDHGPMWWLWWEERRWARGLLYLTAACAAWLVGRLTHRLGGRRVVIPAAATAGALTTAVWSSLIGILIGAAVGASLASERLRYLERSLVRAIVGTLLPVLGLSALAGWAGTAAYYSDNRVALSLLTIVGLLLLLVALAVVALAAVGRRAGQGLRVSPLPDGTAATIGRAGLRRCIHAALVVVVLVPVIGCGLWSGRQTDVFWRAWQLGQVGAYYLESFQGKDMVWQGRWNLGAVDFDQRATDADLKLVRGSPRINSITIDSPQVTDAGFRHLAHISGLTHLKVSDAAVTNDGVKSLQSLRSIYSLEFRRTRLSRAALSTIAALPRLAHLRLEGLKDDGHGLACLKPLKRITQLELTRSNVTDADLAEITSINLQWLTLRQNQIVGSGLGQLTASSRLGRLDLSDNPLEGRFLSYLVPLQLSYLWLDGVELNPAALQALKRHRRLRVLAVARSQVACEPLMQLLTRTKLHELSIDGSVLRARPHKFDHVHFLNIHVLDQTLEGTDIARLIESDGDIHLQRCTILPSAVAELMQAGRHQFRLVDCSLDTRFRELLQGRVMWGEEGR